MGSLCRIETPLHNRAKTLRFPSTYGFRKETVMSDQIGPWLAKAKSYRFSDLARLLSLLEEAGPRALSRSQLLRPPQTALRLGITGPPGAGKSTLVNSLISHWRSKGAKVGVLAIDPSSPFSGGAILGDRIRYSEHFSDPGVFIRSLGTRGSLGGICSAAYLMLRAMDLWAFDLILVETVGVGQTEFDILHVADLVCLVLVPESGDSIQAMKAGLMEIADIFVINKSDRPGADSLAREIQFYFEGPGEESAHRLFKTVATQGLGVKELALRLWELGATSHLAQNRLDPQRLRHEALSFLRHQWVMKSQDYLETINCPEDLQKILISQGI